MNNEDISENPSAALARFEKIYQEAKLLVARYEEQIKEIDTLRRKIDSYIGDSPNDIGPVGSLLIQGKELLLDFQNRRVPFDELQNLFLSVRTEYENARALLLSSLLTQFMDSDETVQWELDIPKVISLSHSREQHLARLQDFTYVQQIIGQFDDNESDYQKLILQKTFKRVENNSRAISFLILLTTAFAGLCYDQLPHDFLSKSVTEATLLSAFGLFTVGLQPDMPEPHRKAAAGWISQLSLQEYLSVVTDSCLIEASPVVKEALLLYLNKHPEGTFWGFFLFASPEIRKAICHDIYLIERLLMEPQENSDLFTLVFLGNVSGDWFDWVIQFLPRLAGTSNSKVRSKVLDYIVQMEYKGDQVREIIATLLYDPEIEIRVAAYKYIAKLNDESFLPKVYESIMEEKSEFVEQEAIFALGELTSPASVHYILLLSLEPNNKLRNLAFTVLANKDIIDKDYRKLFELIKKVVQRKHSLGLLDKFMLNRMRKRSSNLGEVVQRLLKFRDPTS